MTDRPSSPPARPSDEELYTLLQLAHGVIYQHCPLVGSHRPFVQSVQAKLQNAWEGLKPARG